MFESKRRAFIFLVLSFILAVIAGSLFYSKYQDLNADLGKMTEVYVTGQSIPSRQLIKPEQVVSIEILNRYVTDGHILSLYQLENQVSIIPLKEGNLITHNILKPHTELTSYGNRLVEMLIEMGNIHFDDDLDYLDRVDIIVSHSFEDDPATEIFMTDVPVHKIINNEDGLAGVALEVPSDAALELIHMQNYADYIRILKSGVADIDDDEWEEEDVDTEPNDDEEDEDNDESENEEETSVNEDNE